MAQRYLSLILWALLLPLSGFADPVEFIRNDGQWPGPFSYKAKAGNAEIFLAGNTVTYRLWHPANVERMDAVHHGITKEAKLEFHVYRMSFLDANPEPAIIGGKEQSWYYNYFLGKDPSRWKGNIHPDLALDYKMVYPGIDLHFSSEGGLLKYEWQVSEGNSPDLIRMKIEGADGLATKGGKLIIKTSVGEVQELRPVAYQYTADGRKEVECRYHLKDDVLSYDFPEGWDKSLPLIIDPTVVFCSFTGSTADNWGYTATYDAGGNFYLGGIMLDYPANTGGSYPTTTGAFQTTWAGGVTDPNASTSDTHGVGYASDIAIMKLNPAGTTRIWATYIGGSDNEQPHSMMVDANNNLVIAGVSYSSDYPVTSGCFDNSLGGNADLVITKLNAAGSALIGSTYVGGSAADGVNFNGSEYLFGNLKYNYGDNARSEIILDKNANVYVTASTRSSNFPVTASAYQSSIGGAQDAVLVKLNANLTSLIYSTYLGGSSDDAGYVLALDTAQTHLYVGGGTMSSNFPTTGGAWKSSYQGGTDGYIARFLNSGSYALQKVTFVGMSGYDQVYGVQVDLENGVYAMGQTLGGTFPVTSGVYSNAGSSQFVIKLDSLLTTDLFSTVFGSGTSSQTNISPVAFLVDTCQNIYISGWGGNLAFGSAPSTVGTTAGMPVTPSTIPSGGTLSASTDGADFYFIVLAKNASSLLFGAYHGRSSTDAAKGEHVDGGTSRFDRQGVVYQAICGGCAGFGGFATAYPTTSGSWSPSNGNANCNEVALKIAFQMSVPDAIANASPKARGCSPLPVQFQNTSVNAISYTWDFKDGSPIDTSFAPKHTFSAPGVYNVQLVVYNPNACKTRDTAIITITVDSNRIAAGFNYILIDSCGPYRASFANTSVYSKIPGAAGRTTFLWLFGDGSQSTSTNPGTHTYASGGTYTVTLIMRDTAACNSPDTVRKVVKVDGTNVKALFGGPDSVCLRSAMTFTDASQNATGITWYFGDGGSSVEAQPVHTYQAPGSYTIVLVAVNPNSCNKRDTLKKTIYIRKMPTANFTFAPVIPVPNMPIEYTNKSQNADFYTWAFGDGAFSADTNPSHLFHKKGSYRTCLTARTLEGCADSMCKEILADVKTALDVPSAFTPNGDGANDMLFVRGAAVETVNLKIFNRWGEKVFETNSLEKGWDGTYKGKPQEMDAYGYVLYATFIDGSSTQKKGNITLIR